jgi:hypothetical protein
LTTDAGSDVAVHDASAQGNEYRYEGKQEERRQQLVPSGSGFAQHVINPTPCFVSPCFLNG